MSHDRDSPIEIKRPRLWPKNHSFEDLSGRRFGQLAVLGYYGSDPDVAPSKAAFWVVRCSCGTYTLRTTRTIKKAWPDAACDACTP